MYGTASFCFQNNLFGLFAAYAAGFAGTDAALGIFAQVDAAFEFQIGSPLAHHPAKLPAFAGRDADAVPGFVQPVRDFLKLYTSRFIGYGLFYRYRSHQRRTHRHCPGNHLLQVQNVIEKCRRCFRIPIGTFLCHDRAFHIAGGKYGQLDPVHAVVVTIVFQKPDMYQLIRHLRGILYAHSLASGQFINVI